MQVIAGVVLAVVGVVLLIMGINASDSIASDLSRFFTGSPTDRTIWLIVGGAAALVAGAMIAGLPQLRLKKSA